MSPRARSMKCPTASKISSRPGDVDVFIGKIIGVLVKLRTCEIIFGTNKRASYFPFHIDINQDNPMQQLYNISITLIHMRARSNPRKSNLGAWRRNKVWV